MLLLLDVENYSRRDSKAPTSQTSAGSVFSLDVATVVDVLDVVDVDVPMLCSLLSTLSVVAPGRLNSEVCGAGATLVDLVVELAVAAVTVVDKVDVSKPSLCEILVVVSAEVAAVAEVVEPVEVVETVVTLDVVDDLVPQPTNCNAMEMELALRCNRTDESILTCQQHLTAVCDPCDIFL